MTNLCLKNIYCITRQPLEYAARASLLEDNHPATYGTSTPCTFVVVLCTFFIHTIVVCVYALLCSPTLYYFIARINLLGPAVLTSCDCSIILISLHNTCIYTTSICPITSFPLSLAEKHTSIKLHSITSTNTLILSSITCSIDCHNE